ncbi:Protein of unknown function [Pyronema omphalodes CBS 100304]|uniref:Uncharacterized protein n=1 Tax=Pyronema omphalodes (strain CBS 100304) TaxID=1076935 RepID=U4L8S2_PYROM|nr:Protein of unknown function [Pyronema omphalodes CBS 100304]
MSASSYPAIMIAVSGWINKWQGLPVRHHR